MNNEDKLHIYCVYCKSGSEEYVANSLRIKLNVEVIFPTKQIQEKRNGEWQTKEKPITPGYIFIYSKEKLVFEKDLNITNLYKILQYEDKTKELIGQDYEYALLIYTHNGCLETSKVMTSGSEVRIIDGPLKDLAGKIIKLDKHKKKAWIETVFFNELTTITLGVEFLEELTPKA